MKDRILPPLELLTAVLIGVFWVLFFTLDPEPQNAPDCYQVFERAFPLPDMCLALVLAGAGILLFRKNRFGPALSLVAGGSLVFLGLLDFSFNIQNGVYSASSKDLVLNSLINGWSFGFGMVLIVSFLPRSAKKAVVREAS